MSKVNLYMAEVGSSAAQFIGLIWDGVYNYDDFNLVGDKYVLKSDRAANGSARDMIQPGDIKYRDVDGDGTITDKDVVVIGRSTAHPHRRLQQQFHVGPFQPQCLFPVVVRQRRDERQPHLPGRITRPTDRP